jgi:hypothetical protein
MWALVIAFLGVGGLVKFAYNQKEEPTLRPALRRAKLIRLAKMPVAKLTLDQAEDGMVLSRQFDTPELEKRFRVVAERLKAARRKHDRTHGATQERKP